MNYQYLPNYFPGIEVKDTDTEEISFRDLIRPSSPCPTTLKKILFKQKCLSLIHWIYGLHVLKANHEKSCTWSLRIFNSPFKAEYLNMMTVIVLRKCSEKYVICCRVIEWAYKKLSCKILSIVCEKVRLYFDLTYVWYACLVLYLSCQRFP